MNDTVSKPAGLSALSKPVAGANPIPVAPTNDQTNLTGKVKVEGENLPVESTQVVQGAEHVHDTGKVKVETAPIVESEAAPIVQPKRFEKIYTCLPLKNLQIGKFRFENGQMTLDSEAEVAEFERVLNHPKLPAVTRAKIKTIDLAAAEALVAKSIPRATRGMDQGINPGLQDLKAQVPKVGTDNIGFKSNVGNK